MPRSHLHICHTILMWILFRLGYAHDTPGPYQAELINDLYQGKKDRYEELLAQSGYNFLSILGDLSSARVEQMGIGMFIRPLECDGVYLLGPAPEHIDPLYECMRAVSKEFIRLIDDGEVPPPSCPPLDSFNIVETEVSHMVGRWDHVTPFQIGISLGDEFPKYEVFVADDNHMLNKSTECREALRNSFFEFGLGSEELRAARNSAACAEWKPE